MASPAPRAARSSRPLRDRAYVPPTRRLRACAASLLYASDRPPASRRGADPRFSAAARRMRHAGHAEEACKAFPAGRVGKAAVASTFIVGGAALHAVGPLPAPGAILHGALRKMRPFLIQNTRWRAITESQFSCVPSSCVTCSQQVTTGVAKTKSLLDHDLEADSNLVNWLGVPRTVKTPVERKALV